ncbi:MAG: pyrroline-5-carboxylate reductase [Actinomycetota bacterium]|nr:MAG: pyrroline-5-carboxylate reductase [Actinomycetota bacterium]
MGQVAIVGAGVMGEALLAGLLRAGREPADLVVIERRPERAAELNDRYGVTAAADLTAVAAAETVLLVVKPQDMGDVLAQLRASVQPGALVVSLAAGITTAYLEQRLPDGTAVVRVMPNTPALVDAGVAAMSPGAHCDGEHLDRAEGLLRSVGTVVRVAEKYQDAVTALSGSGPAYFFYVVEAMVEAGVLLGLPRATAAELVVGTMVGSARMLAETGEHPSVLREQVSSPAGTTIAALRELDDHKVRAAFLTAIEAARDRSAELAAGS